VASEPSARPGASVGWSDAAEHAPDGLAVVDASGRFVRVNAIGAELLGCAAEDLADLASPFETRHDDGPQDGGAEQWCVWTSATGEQREFAYRVRLLPDGGGPAIVAFRDVSAERRHHRRIAAIARTSVKAASEESITATLDALAQQVLQADALAAVHIMTLDSSGRSLQLMGSAGFPSTSDFFDRMAQCRSRGATLHMLAALEKQAPVVVPERWRTDRDKPQWEPLREYHEKLDWDWFASVPLMIRGRAEGVLNAFFATGQVVGQPELDFLVSMAEQAAVALDYAALLRYERDVARREERQRLARDLHDSIVQQVFSIGLQAKSMDVLGGGTAPVPAENVRRIAAEVGTLSRTVLADLRAMVHELRPSTTAELGLDEAIRALVRSTSNRTGLRFSLIVGKSLDRVPAEIAEDVYRIVAEAIHNVVKHADASRVTIRCSLRSRTLTLTVTDDGRGLAADLAAADGEPAHGYGVTTMRERAEKWGGSVHIRQLADSGTKVRAVIPIPGGLSLLTERTAGPPGGLSIRPNAATS
jgi:signal transduction histidine kinase